jgi:hypothetical protein
MFELHFEIENEELRKLYQKQIDILNRTYSFTTSDSGFDLFIPNDYSIKPKETMKIDLQIKCQPKFAGGYYLYPRSSFSKTSLRLKELRG